MQATKPKRPSSRPRLKPEESRHWRLWKHVCTREGIKTSDTEARHHLYRQALGYDRSHKSFSHKEWDLVLYVLHCRANGYTPEPENLEHVPDMGERRRLVFAINEIADDAYIQHIAKGKFGCMDWRNLPNESLVNLKITLINRVRSKQRARRRQPELAYPS